MNRAGQGSSIYVPVARSGEVQWRVEQAQGGEKLQGEAGGEVRTPAGLLVPPRKILVVDDDPVMRMLLKMGLRTPEFECVLAENGKAAQELVPTNRPELILLDLLMPVMDGLSFLQWLRQTAQDQTPVLVFSNVNDPKITQEALKTGANGFACKPLHLKELMASIQKLVPR